MLFRAESHDRINVQNNPVNLIDPLGLEGFVGIGVSPVGPDPSAHPVFQPGTPQNDIIVNDVNRMYGSLGMSNLAKMALLVTDPSMVIHLMADRGKQTPRNWATEEAKLKGQEDNMNPCDVLDNMLEQAKQVGDCSKIRDIQKAQKFLGCRNKQKRKSQ